MSYEKFSLFYAFIILIFGSPGASHSLLKMGLIDEYWIFVNPVYFRSCCTSL
jgi:hypothetical protein